MTNRQKLSMTFCLMSIITLMILVGSSLMLSIFSMKSGIGNYYRWEVCLRSGNEIGYTNADDNGHKGCITSNTNMTAVVKQEQEQEQDPISADLPNLIIPTFGKSVYDTLISSIVLNGLAFILTTYLVYLDLSGQVDEPWSDGSRRFSGCYAAWKFWWIFLFIIAIVDIAIFANIFTHLQPSDVDIANNIFYTPFRLDILSVVIFSLGAVFIVQTLLVIVLST